MAEESAETRRLRVRVEYPGVFEYRYARWTVDEGWHTGPWVVSKIFPHESAAAEAIAALHSQLHQLKPKITIEHLRSFDPDWCVSPGLSMKDLMDNLGITTEQLVEAIGPNGAAILAGDAPFDPDTAQKLTALLGGSNEYWQNLNNNYQEGLRKGLHVTK